MFYKVLVNFLNHDFKCLVLITTAIVVEVKVKELNVVFVFALVHLAHIFSCKALLSSCLISKQVNAINRTVC